MLSIKPIGSTSTEISYYANLGTAENLDYYSQDGERPGEWWGTGAEELQLKGPVNANEFANVLKGLFPDGTPGLVQPRRGGNVKRRPGWDFTFTPPKGFSAARSQAKPEDRGKLDRGAKAALHKTLYTLQEICGMSRRGKDTHEVESAKMIGAIFSHDTARGVPGEIPDPCSHFHVVLVNASVRSDGTTGTLDSRWIQL